jgi:hypothetical protein
MSSDRFNASAIAIECNKLMAFTGSSGGISAPDIWFIVPASILIAFTLFVFGMVTDMYMVNYQFKKACKLQGAEGDEALLELFKFHMKTARGNNIGA